MASQGYYGAPPQEPAYQMQNAPPQQPPYQTQDQQQYAPPPQPPPQYGQPQPAYSDEKGSFDQAFKVDKPKWNDLWAGILLIAVFLGYVAVSGLALNGYDSYFTGGGIYNNSNRFGLNSNTIVLFAFVLAVAFVLSWLYISLARIFTKQFIWITGILHIVFGFVTAIYMLSRRYWSGGIVFLLFAILSVIFFISWIPRIPFSTLMLQTSIDVSKKYGHVYIVSLVGGFIATAFGAWSVSVKADLCVLGKRLC